MSAFANAVVSLSSRSQDDAREPEAQRRRQLLRLIGEQDHARPGWSDAAEWRAGLRHASMKGCPPYRAEPVPPINRFQALRNHLENRPDTAGLTLAHAPSPER